MTLLKTEMSPKSLTVIKFCESNESKPLFVFSHRETTSHRCPPTTEIWLVWNEICCQCKTYYGFQRLHVEMKTF